ncbi:MAG: glycosyltransferase [Prevotella sp.]|nr:glycosyltransferase [Prevotella sp.]
MTGKRVSIVLCTYNGSRYLREQMDTLVGQTYPVSEIIAQDDGSSDHTMDILREYASRYPYIKVFTNDGEHGVNDNFFHAIRRATGDYVAICDQDDVWEKDKLARQMAAVGRAVLCAGRSVPFSQDGSPVNQDSRTPNVTVLRMMYSAEIAGHTMLLRRDFLMSLPMDCGMYHHNYYDMIFSVAAAACEGIVWLDDVLVHQRRYQDATTFSSSCQQQPSVSNGWNMLKWCLSHYGEVHALALPYYNEWEELLRLLPVDTKSRRDGIRMMQLQKGRGVVNFLRFQWFCLRHRTELFHTRGSDPFNLLRALLYPLTSCYYRRDLIKDRK